MKLSGGFPSNSQALFGTSLTPYTADYDLRVPWWFQRVCWARANLLPLRNRKRALDAHTRLVKGGAVVFCGLVRPTEKVVDAFLLGSNFGSSREKFLRLVELDWQGSSYILKETLSDVFERLRNHSLDSPANAASAYAFLSVIQRTATLHALLHSGTPLLVNEYGSNVNIDPYSANAYHNNLFIDFGSTRGPDRIYPRMVEINLTKKPLAYLRFLGNLSSLQTWLQNTSANSFWQACQADANQVRGQWLMRNERLQ